MVTFAWKPGVVHGAVQCLKMLHGYAHATKGIELTLSLGVIKTSLIEEQRLRLREHIRSGWQKKPESMSI